MIGELWAITNTRAKGKNGGIMKKGKIQIYKDKGGGYRFRLLAGNGKIVAIGESYTEKRHVYRAIDSVMKILTDSLMIKSGIQIVEVGRVVDGVRGE